MSAEKESSVSQRRLSCTKCFDALWFCYSPVHQLQQYYREGVLDNCYGKWSALWDCLYLKTKPSSQLQLKADWRNELSTNKCNVSFNLSRI
ncbi:hypothetical protein Goklo_017959 [Gossypium klotzschianum]|uniref:Uncharacterized protein n=1 Tax=Gossypium klotzschianum TaxID=34286 RepID=A0A7J8UJB5_9ROSI|nr:hypothetical protein [Gossypium klotzschianum]